VSELLASIKELYFRTSKQTIARDFDRAVDLLKSMNSEEERERAAVFMEGLAAMRAQWLPTPARASGAPRSGAARARSGRSTGASRRIR
jgi:hypothetical protein